MSSDHDHRPICRVCKGLGTRPGPKRLLRHRKPIVCVFCFGTGRQPSIIDSGPIHLEMSADQLLG